MHHCDECLVVESTRDILLYNTNRELKEKVTSNPELCGKFTQPGWSGHSCFYVFKCENCSTVCVDYPHGYTQFGLLFLRCSNCCGDLPLQVPRYNSIYIDADVVIPQAKLSDRIKEFQRVLVESGIKKPVMVTYSRSFLGVRLLFRKIIDTSKQRQSN